MFQEDGRNGVLRRIRLMWTYPVWYCTGIGRGYRLPPGQEPDIALMSQVLDTKILKSCVRNVCNCVPIEKYQRLRQVINGGDVTKLYLKKNFK